MNMECFRLAEMVKGWFVGGFSPAAFKTSDCEVAVKHYKAGQTERAHFHKVATEITVVVAGKVRMAGREWEAGDIVVLKPGEVTDFEAMTDAINVVVKHPGATDDKYELVAAHSNTGCGN
jgi:quercetin dioxygenase-like cupin family protein